MGAGGFQLTGQVEIVFEGVLLFGRVAEIAGVTDRGLAQLAGLEHRVHGVAHVLDPVQGIEDAEDIDPRRRRLVHEVAHHVVGIVGVADAVGGAQQHLLQLVGHGVAKPCQAFPGAFVEEAHGHIEGGPAPGLDGQQVGQQPRIGGCRQDQVVGTHAGRHQGLVGVAEGGVGDQNTFLFTHPTGESFGSQRLQALTVAGRDVVTAVIDGLGRHQDPGPGPARHLRVAVDDNVADEGQKPGRPVPAFGHVEQLRRVVDEARGGFAAAEFGMPDQGFQEHQVGGHAADTKFAERPVHALDGLQGRGRPCGDLFQQGIVKARDQGPRIRGAAVETDAEAGGAAIGGDAAVIGNEIVLRVLGGDPALDGMAVEADIGLFGDAAFGGAEHGPLRDANLRLDQIDAGDGLGHRMLHLDARVDLDEKEIARVRVHQELDGAGASVPGMAADGQRRPGEAGPLFVVEIGRRRPFHDLLVAALDRAVALEQMTEITVMIAEDLDFHMPRPDHQLLEVNLIVAEGGLGLAPGGRHLIDNVCFVFYHPHAAPTTAPAGLEHDRQADGPGCLHDGGLVLGQRCGGRHHRHPGRHRQVAGGDFIAERAHDIGRRADEDDPRLRTRLGEFRVLGQEAVTGVDGIDSCVQRHADDGLDIQVGVDGALALADQVALVGLEAVQGEAVFPGIDGQRPHAQFGGGAKHANGDFAPIGDKQAFDFTAFFGHRVSSARLRGKSAARNKPGGIGFVN